MCGLCGIFGKNSPEQIRVMIQAIRHRGPDGESYVSFQWGSLGFCWLDIFGPDKNPQPAIAENIAVVFNGEIYNFKELVSLFKNDRIEDEATLILNLYNLYGENSFGMLKGMFAIAILKPDKVILVRDKFGIKPLVYFTEGNCIYFASEIKALLQLNEKSFSLNMDSLAETSVFGFVFNLEETMFEGIKQVAPGSYLVFQDGSMISKKYYSVPGSFYSNESWISANVDSDLHSLFNISAKNITDHSKSKQAVYLSGGVDSSLMTDFLKKHLSSLNTFTLFDHSDSDDRLFSGKVAENFRTNHLEKEIDTRQSLKWLRHYLYHYESLVTDGLFNVLGSLAFHILSYEVGKEFKVAYCGEGADELFGGYYWLQAHPLGVGDRLRSRSIKVNHGNTRVHEYIMNQFPDDDLKAQEFRKKIFDFLMGPGLTNCHLWSVDRSCSAFSFEARPFYLYDDIAEWALSLPINYKVTDDKKTKIILKNFLRDSGDPIMGEIADRQKIGMPSALSSSLKFMSSHASKIINEYSSIDLPHKEFPGFLFTDLEKIMFDIFYEIFFINQGNRLSSSSNFDHINSFLHG